MEYHIHPNSTQGTLQSFDIGTYFFSLLQCKNCSSVGFSAFNGSQLAKMKKSIPDMSLPWNLKGRSSWSKKMQLCLKNYDLCEYVEFGAISWKFDILSIIA